MDSRPIVPRMLGLIRHIRYSTPDVICLQELTQQTYMILSNALCQPRSPCRAAGSAVNESDLKENKNHSKDNSKQLSENDPATPRQTAQQCRYVMHCGSEWPDELPYFCAILTRHDLFKDPVDLDTCRFTTSSMFRGYIHLCGTLGIGKKVSLVTSHLESLQTSSAKRKQQLCDILDLQRNMVGEGFLTIFAGDTNLREAEVPARHIQKVVKQDATEASQRKTKKARIEAKFQDAWLLSGKDATHKFTWDMSINDNLDGFNEFKPKARYDRAFLLAPSTVKMTVPSFQLVGKQRLGCGKFISDHWGMLFTTRFEGEI